MLPFTNMSADAEQEYFSDGFTEDIITDLTKVSALFVVARNTAFGLKGSAVDLGQITRQLKVSHVVQGSVRKAGGRVRITAQLIEAGSGGQIWAERSFTRSEIVGFVAGLGTTFAALPDIIAMFKRRSSGGMNPRMAAIMGLFQIAWLYYGFLILALLVFPLWLPAESARNLVHTQGWYWLYLSNVQVAINGWQDPLHLGHLWSLGVEEQFYLLWPIAVWAHDRRWLMRLAAGCFIGALAMRIAMPFGMDELGAYVLLPTRMDSLAAGAFLALVIRNQHCDLCWYPSPDEDRSDRLPTYKQPRHKRPPDSRPQRFPKGR